MSEERNQYAVVPFDTFERYLGPRYENIPAWSTFWKMGRFSTLWRRPQACMNLATTPLLAHQQLQSCLSPFMTG